ncbi:MAG: 5-formyltetrahydrofolate cyclo-ligase [Dermatophilaceae bacterium]
MDARVEAKRAARSQVRARRRARASLPGRDEAAARLAAAACALVDQRSSGTGCRVTAYEARPTEPPTDVLVRVLRETGHQVLLPVTNVDRTLDWDLDGHRLPPEAIGTAALVLTPGLAVDRAGRRLGQGGGSYDAALAFVPAGVPVVTLLWDDELVDEPVPTEPHDRPVDAVITPDRGLVWLRPPR